MSVIVTILLYVFGLDPKTGKLNINCANCDSKPNASNLIYSSVVTPKNPSVKYVDVSYSENNVDERNATIPTNWSSDPEYA